MERLADLGNDFEKETELHKALRANIEQLEAGLKIIDGGKERTVPSGKIDITAEDESGKTVVIELKSGVADRDAIGQIASYLGDVANGGPGIRGILIAHEFSPRALAAARMISCLELHRYGYRFSFERMS
jgi:endonuclease